MKERKLIAIAKAKAIGAKVEETLPRNVPRRNGNGRNGKKARKRRKGQRSFVWSGFRSYENPKNARGGLGPEF